MTARLPHILLVDDEKDNLEALKRLLRKDYTLTLAQDGSEALEIFKNQHRSIDVIVSDQRMPGMSGSELLGQIETMDSHVTRVLLTGFSDLEAVIDAVNRGHIWRYIAKPWEPDDLKMALRQASERTQLRRSLDQSRLELERALIDLRARDWARERLLQILLHEFRTAPQILQALQDLDSGGEDAPARQRFIESLLTRFQSMEKDISALMADEKHFSQLPKSPLKLGTLLEQLGFSFTSVFSGTEPSFLSHAESLKEVIRHFHALLSENSARAPVTLSLDVNPGERSDIFLTLAIERPQADSKPLLPSGLQDQNLEPQLAWPLLLEPFVGSEDFRKHSQGLRIESARKARWLTALGGRSEFSFERSGNRVELLIAFRTS